MNSNEIQNSNAPTSEVMLQSRLIEACELQFRLASAVRIATTSSNQPLDVPTSWSHGKHTVKYEEIALTPKLADKAACFLKRSTTYMMAVQILIGLKEVFKNPRESNNNDIIVAYQIVRMIRNSFTHRPLKPIWSIDEDCRNKVFEIPNIIRLDTSDLNGCEFDWRHYGGLLALFRMSQFVRRQLLGCPDQYTAITTGEHSPKHNREIIQQGNMILTKIDKIPEGAKRVNIKPLPDGGIPLGDGHVLYPKEDH